MIIENFEVGRVIIHEVFQRDESRNVRTPRYGENLITLDDRAKAEFRSRIIAAMGRSSQSVEMAILQSGTGTMLSLCRYIMASDDDQFITRSREAVDHLASAQQSRKIPGGILVVFDGRVSYPSVPLVGFIKAEPHNGFTMPSGRLDLEFLENLFLTPHSRLYKIGMFIEKDSDLAASDTPADGFSSCVFDACMTSANQDRAAQYFYEGFLGCGFPASAARLTKGFYEGTREFIRKLDVSEEKKMELNTALHTYLKVDTSPTIQVNAFAGSYFVDAPMKDAYARFMAERSIPTTAIAKDISDIKSKLKLRKVKFRSDIRLTVPADRFDELVHVKVIDAPQESRNGSAKWTVLTIHDVISEQE